MHKYSKYIMPMVSVSGTCQEWLKLQFSALTVYKFSLNLNVPTPQNGQTHPNNLPGTATESGNELLECT